MGIGRNQWIITRDHSRQAYLASSSNREMMTCVETISGDGAVLPPMFIFSAAQHMEHWFNADHANDILFAVSNSGCTNNEITLEWLHHFDQHSSMRQAGAWRLLILDGYGSHCTFEFINYCNSHRIVPFCLPPHATHLMQPLDVVVFEPYKHHCLKAVDLATRTGCSDFNRTEFLHIDPRTGIQRHHYQVSFLTYRPDPVQSHSGAQSIARV